MKNRLPVIMLALALFAVNFVLYAQKNECVNIYNDIFRPDSLLTQEQIDIKAKLTSLIPGTVKVEQGVVVTSLKKRDFKKKEIPVYYYKMLLRDLKDINDWIKSGKITPEEFEKQLTVSDFAPIKLPMVKTRSESTDGYTYWGEVTDWVSALELFREIKKKYKDKCIEFLVIDSPNGKMVYYKECD